MNLALRVDFPKIWVIDQTLLPKQEVWIELQSVDQTIEVIQRLAVRGAPLIGVVAGLSLAQEAVRLAEGKTFSLPLIRSAAKRLRAARPTAVNLMKAMDHIVLHQPDSENKMDQIVTRALQFMKDDIQLCEALGRNGAEKIHDGMNILTHCNTGSLATAGMGTALAAIHTAWLQGKKIHVYVDETRPLLQGGRLTTWELKKLGIPHTLICDNMAGFLMQKKKVDLVLVGADRIAKNGDFANKVGTYGLAVLSKAHGVPMYTIAPRTTFDPECESGDQIHIEERNPEEVRGTSAPVDTAVWNPAFDVTPRHWISGVIFEDGMI